MHKRFLIAASALVVMAGCGGGGGSSISGGGGGPIPAPTAAPVGSAKFTVDARTGEVKVEPISTSRAAFSGGALSFTSSLLLSEGSPERRVLRVTAKNNTKETIGVDGTMRLLFTNFQNANFPLIDLRSLVQTSTFWGTGAATTTLGGQSTATIQGPVHLAYNEAQDTLFAINNVGSVLTAKEGTISTDSSETGLLGGIALGPGFRLHGLTSWINMKVDGLAPEILVGTGSITHVDGTFATARFTDINDIFMIRATSTNDFEAVVADGTRMRLVQRNAAFPAGSVTTLFTTASAIRGVSVKDGAYYFTTSNILGILRGSSTVFLGVGAGGYLDGPESTARFSSPGQLEWVGESLFVADTGNNRVRQLNLRPGGNVFAANNWWVSTLSGNGTATSVDGTANFMTHASPVSLAKGPGETLFVADQAGNKIRKITPISNRFLNNFGDLTPNPTDTAQLVNATDYIPSVPTRTPLIFENQSIPAGGSAILGDWQFVLPEGLKSFSFVVTVEAETAVSSVLPSVANTGSGTKGSPLVSVRTLAGSTAPGNSDGSGANAAFSNLRGICFTPDGDAYVADQGSSTIRHISKSGRVSTILTAKAPGYSFDGDYTVNSISGPIGITSNLDGTKLFFTESSGTVRVAELTGQDPSSPTSWTVTTIAGLAFNYGNTHGNGQIARFSSSLSAIVYMADNSLLVCDSAVNVIKRINKQGTGSNPSSYFVSVFAGSSVGTAGYVDAVGSVARFSSPVAMAVTKSGYVLVADNINNRIRRIDSGGVTTTFSGSGAYGATDSTTPLGATFSDVQGIAADPSGYAYICDIRACQIRRLSPTGIVTTVAGTALLSGYSDGSGNTATFNDPRAVALSPGGDLWVLEGTRIRIVQRIITN
jgi:hypothetical protein